MEMLFSLQIFTRNKKIRSGVSISCHKGVLNKHSCNNFFEENRLFFEMPVFSGDSNLEEGD